jgi:hypothetical protein
VLRRGIATNATILTRAIVIVKEKNAKLRRIILIFSILYILYINIERENFYQVANY